jgi:type II secretory pathway pseudopilin PulG
MVELLVSLAVIAVLLSLLLPLLIHAKRISTAAVCASNLRQLGVAWQSYVHDFEQFPQYGAVPEWKYGGVEFLGAERAAVLDPDRPINRYIKDDLVEQDRSLAQLYRCAGDTGVHRRGQPTYSPSVLPGGSCYNEYGTSYRANPNILDSTRAGIDKMRRPLFVHEVHVSASRLLVMADTAWFYATRPAGQAESQLEASWHGAHDAGNMLAMDGSVRFVNFAEALESHYVLKPRPDLRSGE